MQANNFKRLLLTSAIAGSLSACSSGGGGSKDSTPELLPYSPPPYSSFTTQTKDPTNFATRKSDAEDQEYDGMGYALEMINASSAYARGGTGKGVNVVVVDSGIDSTHIEFEKENGSSKAVAVSNSYSIFGAVRDNNAIRHGTMVAGVIAAQKDGNPYVEGESLNLHGVAYEAEIRAFEIPLGSGSGPYEPIDLADISITEDQFFSDIFNNTDTHGEIINMSFGYEGLITNYTRSEIEAAFPQFINTLKHTGESAADRPIYVLSAGNSHNDIDAFGNVVNASSPNLLAGLPYRFSEFDDHMIAVVAVDKNGVITSYSNRCGVAKSFCLAAPGGGATASDDFILSTIPDPDGADPNFDYYSGAAGTSFAAPLVSGALAILKQMFPTVGNDEIVDRLLDTANDEGIYADSNIYGHGLLDLNAATAPVGVTSLTTTSNLNGPSAPMGSTSITITGGALGDSLTNSLAAQNLTVFDSMGFPFQIAASSLIARPQWVPETSNLSHQQLTSDSGWQIRSGRDIDNGYRDRNFHPDMKQLPSRDYFAMQFTDPNTGRETFTGARANPGWFFGVYANTNLQPASTTRDDAFAAPWLQFARQGWSSGGALASGKQKLRFGVFRGEASWDQFSHDNTVEGHGALIEWAHQWRDSGISIQGGALSEQQSFLGLQTQGALGQNGSSNTWFSGLNAYWQMGTQWQGVLALYGGVTNPQIQNGLLSVNDELFSSSFAMGVSSRSMWQQGDQLGFYISQPLRIENGDAQLQVATGRTVDRQVTYEQLGLNLEPTAREVRVEMNYRFDMGMARASTSVHYVQNPGHNSQADNDAAATISVSLPLRF
ncbi:S8 family peptidase [Porticoccaceae bacterium LTM1]|nr:S8 family peptidase [Porticoccaceae bacterium LTM1]